MEKKIKNDKKEKIWFRWNNINFFCYSNHIYQNDFSKELQKIKSSFESNEYCDWNERLNKKDILKIFNNSIFKCPQFM